MTKNYNNPDRWAKYVGETSLPSWFEYSSVCIKPRATWQLFMKQIELDMCLISQKGSHVLARMFPSSLKPEENQISSIQTWLYRQFLLCNISFFVCSRQKSFKKTFGPSSLRVFWTLPVKVEVTFSKCSCVWTGVCSKQPTVEFYIFLPIFFFPQCVFYRFLSFSL